MGQKMGDHVGQRLSPSKELQIFVKQRLNDRKWMVDLVCV